MRSPPPTAGLLTTYSGWPSGMILSCSGSQRAGGAVNCTPKKLWSCCCRTARNGPSRPLEGAVRSTPTDAAVGDVQGTDSSWRRPSGARSFVCMLPSLSDPLLLLELAGHGRLEVGAGRIAVGRLFSCPSQLPLVSTCAVAFDEPSFARDFHVSSSSAGRPLHEPELRHLALRPLLLNEQ